MKTAWFGAWLLFCYEISGKLINHKNDQKPCECNVDISQATQFFKTMCSEQTREIFSQVADLQSAVVHLENMLSLYKEDGNKDYREVRRKNLDIENSVNNLKSLFQTEDSNSQESCHHNCGKRTSNGLHGIFNRKKLLKMFKSYISDLLTNSDEFQNSGIKQLIHHGVKKEMESYIPNLKLAPKHTNMGKGDFNRKTRADSKDAPSLVNQRNELSTDDRKEFTADSYRDNNVQSDGAYQNDMKRIYSILINQGTKVEEVTANLETRIKDLDAQTRNIHSRLESTAQRFVKGSITSELKNVHNNISVIADAYHNLERKTRNITSGHVNYLIDMKIESMGDNIVDRLLHESSPLNNKIQDLEQNGRMLAENSTAEITRVRFELSTLINKMESLNSTMTQNMPLLDKVKESLQIVNDLKRSLPNLEDLRYSISNQTLQNFEQTKAILTLENKVKNLINNESVVFNAIDNYDNRLNKISKDILNIEVREWTQYDFSHSNDRNGCHGGTKYVKKGPKKYEKLYVGVVLCSSTQYKIYLGDNLQDPFLDIGDMYGFGDDHCEFVGGQNSASMTTGMPSYLSKPMTGYKRRHWGEKPQKGRLWVLNSPPMYYQCGVTIP